jgi:hypothetical protein
MLTHVLCIVTLQVVGPGVVLGNIVAGRQECPSGYGQVWKQSWGQGGAVRAPLRPSILVHAVRSRQQSY